MGNVIDLELEKDKRICSDIIDYFNSMEKSQYKLTYLDMFFLSTALLEETERAIIDTINGEITLDELIQHFVDNCSAIYCCYYSFFDSYTTGKDSLASLSQHDFLGILNCIYSSSKSNILIESSCVRFKDFKVIFRDKSYSADYLMFNYLRYIVAKVERLYYSKAIDEFKIKLTENDCINKRQIRDTINVYNEILISASAIESEYFQKVQALNIWDYLENPTGFKEFCRDTIVSKIKTIKDMISKHDYLSLLSARICYADEIEDKYFDDIKKEFSK